MTQISLATFTRSSRILVMAALAAALSGCQGLSEVRSMMPSFLGGGTPRPKPVELAPNPNLLGVRQAWTARIGPVNMPLARQGAVRGDPQALEALAGFNIDDYLKLDKRGQEQYKQGIDTIGQLALMADTPEEWDDTVRQLAQGAPEFQKYIGRFDLRESVIAQAGQAKEFIAQNEPKYMTPAADQDLVNVRDPAALAEFQRSRAGRAAQSQAAPPPPPGFQIDGGPTPTASGNFPRP